MIDFYLFLLFFFSSRRRHTICALVNGVQTCALPISAAPKGKNMLFDRVKPLDAILATAEKKSLTRTLGAFQLTMLGIGAVIGTGIFVLTAEAAQKAGPGMMISFVIAGFVCAFAALCYAEMASMVPVSGSAYTYRDRKSTCREGVGKYV